MSAISKEELEKLEREHGLEPDGLTYQHRCSRIAAVQKGEEWVPPVKEPRRQEPVTIRPKDDGEDLMFKPMLKDHPEHWLYNKEILISPGMYPDKNRNLTFDEPIGHSIVVKEINAGEGIYGAPEDVDRLFGDYEIIREDKSKIEYAKTWLPKVNSHIVWNPTKDIVPRVYAPDGKQLHGLLWLSPMRSFRIANPDNPKEVAMLYYCGLKQLIEQAMPELLPKFKDKARIVDANVTVMDANYVRAVLREHRRKLLLDAQAGLY